MGLRRTSVARAAGGAPCRSMWLAGRAFPACQAAGRGCGVGGGNGGGGRGYIRMLGWGYTGRRSRQKSLAL